MLENENDLKNLIDKLDIDTNANPNHRENLRRKMLASFDESRKSTRSLRTVRSIIMKSKITKLAAAAVVAIALLVPLSFGTSIIIKNLMGSHGTDNFKTQFKLNKNIYIKLHIGTKEERRIVTAGNIRFFKEGQQLLGTLRCSVRSYPKFHWKTTVELISAKGNVLNSTVHIRENGGTRPRGIANWSDLATHFALGSWNDALPAKNFSVTIEQIPGQMATTPDAWLESSELAVVHGRVTGADGKPIANARIQIREKRKPGQRSIAAPDLRTDKQGYYSFDEIEWPYRVGVIIYQEYSSGHGYSHQYLRSNRVLEGTQAIDFSFDQFPTGNAILSGKASEPNGAIIKDFTVDVRRKVDWKDYSGKYLYQFGIKKPLTTYDGRFEIPDLPASVCRVSIIPTKNEILDAHQYIKIRNYLCTLVKGETTEIGPKNAVEKVWYGQVLFPDGSPAVLDLPGVSANIIKWEEGFPEGLTIANVDDDGYFAAYITDEVIEWLRSGRCWLTITVSRPLWSSEIEKDRFPVELLSLQRHNAGVVKISRPKVFYGRIQYENGKPAVPQTPPWPGARVSVAIRYTPATSTDAGHSEDLSDVDNEGYFSFYLTDEELEQLKVGKYKLEIRHPSYEEEMTTYPIGSFPLNMLAKERSTAKGYKLPYKKMSLEFKNLKQQLDSLEKLNELGPSLSAYQVSKPHKLPTNLDDIKAYLSDELIKWAKENIDYFSTYPNITDYKSSEIGFAYDKALLEKTKELGTNVVFLDGHVEYCRTKRLRKLGLDILSK